jgi:sporulation protein YlmC with PRC-barrel domain
MSETEQFRIGSEVACSDGTCGDLRRVVIDPVARALTHLVVEPRDGGSWGHLAPIDLVASTARGIQLRCTKSEFEALPDAEQTQFLPGASGEWEYEQEHMLSWPYYGLGMSAMSIDIGPQPTIYDRLPVGEVQVRRGDHVHATDGAIGRVQGLVVDPSDHHVTHVLLDEGHLWGQRRVAIPISALTGVEDGVRLSLSKDEVRDLPALELDEPDR